MNKPDEGPQIKYTDRLKEVAWLFLKLGATAFGGPAAYIAMMQRETVRQRRWIDDQQFLDLTGALNLIPGPNATETALYLGLKRARWPGFLAAGLLFILPATLATMLLAWIYVRYGSLPQVGWVLYGIKPVVIAIILQALWDLGRTGVKGIATGIIGIAVIVLYLLGLNEILLLFGGAAVMLLIYAICKYGKRTTAAVIALPLFKIPLAALAAGATPISNWGIFLSFLKIGSLLFGGGYVLLAFLKSEFEVRLGWLTNQQLLDAIAAGQITPGPVSSSATFVGYLLGGWPAALLATLGMFLPSFILIALLARFLPLFRKSPWAGAFLDGVNISALGLMAGVTILLGQAAIIDWFTIVLALIAVFLVFRFKFSSAWLILGGGVVGVVYKMIVG